MIHKLPYIATYLGLLSVGDDVLLSWNPGLIRKKTDEQRYTVTEIWKDGITISLCFNGNNEHGNSYPYTGDILGPHSLVKIVPKQIDWEKRVGGRKNE
jgi:hypothetical protein